MIDMCNIHWHIGEVGRDIWFYDLLNHNSHIVGIIWDESASPFIMPRDANGYRCKFTSIEATGEICKIVHENLNRGYESFVIYTSQSKSNLDELYWDLHGLSDKLYRIIIMCKP